MQNVQLQVRELMVKFNDNKSNPSRREVFSKMRGLGVNGLVCDAGTCNQFTLYGQDSDGDVRYFSVSTDGEGNKSYTSNWGQFSVIRANMQDGTVVMLDAAKQGVCAPAKLVVVSDEDKEAITKMTTDEVLAKTQVALSEIARLDDELLYQHVLKEHLRSTVQERIAPVMG